MTISSIRAHSFSCKPAAVLKVTGGDAFTFLQGQFTQDLRPVRDDTCVAYGLWLNQKGKVEADSFVLCRAGEWLVFSYFSMASVIRERLEAYVIADDVKIEDVTGQWAGFSLMGAEVEALLLEELGGGLPEAGVFVEKGDGIIFRGRRGLEPSWEWLYPVGEDALLLKLRTLGFAEPSAVDMERFRIEAGIPAVPRDIGPEDLPNEGGLEHDAISYTKGCYLGQEVMARLKTMGRVRRRLLRVAGAVAVPEVLPAALFVEGKRIGELRSAVGTENGFVGLAMISLLGVAGKRLLSFSPDSPSDIIITDAPA